MTEHTFCLVMRANPHILFMFTFIGLGRIRTQVQRDG